MADDVDVANELINSQFERALRLIREESAQKKMGPEFCLECGEDMPAERRKLGFNMCVPCASETERRKSLYAS